MNGATAKPVIVGIDGSKYAIRAAIWAVDEAVSRDTQLLLVSDCSIRILRNQTG